jgi:5-methylcytosine-specific restriction endonuclease McrA
MGKRQANTPRSQVKSALRKLWLRSRERAAALKRAKYCCEECGVKQSRAKGREVYLDVHHADGIEWEKIMEYIYKHLICNPERLDVLCEKCHDKITLDKPKESD